MARKKAQVSRSEESPLDSTNSVNNVRMYVSYGECQRNLAAHAGGYAVDGCREFMASQADGADGALICAGCGCHRNFHRRVVESEVV